MRRRAVAFLTLLAVWLLWSGHTEPLLLGFGVVSCALVVWISSALGIYDVLPRGGFLVRLLRYGPWLMKEIALSNLAVARIVLRRDLPIAPRLVRVSASQKTALGQVVLANSITLTPGTITLDLRNGSLLVHALTEASAKGLASGEMDRRVTELEGPVDV